MAALAREAEAVMVMTAGAGTAMATNPVVIVGGGMAGLACAYRLVTAGVPVRLIEASHEFGGRVHTTMYDGLPVDDGFQVLFRAYPETRRLMDDVGFSKDCLRYYDRGAICYTYGVPFTFGADPRALVAFPLMTLADKTRLGLLAASVLRTSNSDIWNDTEDEPTETYLRRFGFSKDAIEQFFRPFFAGILLNPSLDTSSKDFRFIYRMLVSGGTFTTPEGIGAIPAQIAGAIRARGGILDTQTGVRKLLLSEDRSRVTGVSVLHGGNGAAETGAQAVVAEKITARAVVVALPGPEARRLLAEIDPAVANHIPVAGLASTTVAWKLSRPLYREKKILLNVDALAGQRRMERGFHLAGQITNISHPDGTGRGHVLIVASVAEACADEHYRTEELPREALATLAKWFPRSGVEADAELLDVRYIPFAQFAQPPGTRERLPANLTRLPNLIAAGEYTESSSIEGAVVSGTRAAEHLRAALARVRE